jgi:His-Xaa-Ser system protein HxsD
MPQAVTESAANEIAIEFSASTQSLDALQAAAYRLIGTATCRIDRSEGRFICHLAPVPGSSNAKLLDTDAAKLRFLELVTDENVRERLAIKTEPLRNLILSLAFGSLTLPPATKD